MKKILLVLVFFSLVFFSVPLLASAQEKDGVLPDGTEFNFGVPVLTSEFSEDGTEEEVIVISELGNEFTSVNKISPRRIDNGYYIGRAYWINRSGMISISIYPNKGASGWTRDRAWNELSRNFSHYANWKNVASLRKQFNCHARPIWPYTGKIPWNIEPSKSSTSVINCN